MDDFDLLVPSSGNTSGYDYLDYSTGNASLDLYINSLIKFVSDNYLIIIILFIIIQLFYGLILQRYFKKINHTQGTWKSFFPFIRYLDFYRLSKTNQLFAFLIIGFIVPLANIIIIPLYYIMLNYAIFKTISFYQNDSRAIKAILCNIFIPLGLPIYLIRMLSKDEIIEIDKNLTVENISPSSITALEQIEDDDYNISVET